MGNCIRDIPSEQNKSSCNKGNGKSSSRCSKSLRKMSSTSIEDRLSDEKKEFNYFMKDYMKVH